MEERPSNLSVVVGWLLVATQAILLSLLVVGPGDGAWTVPRPLRLAGNVLRVAGAAAIILGALRLGRSASMHPAPTSGAVLRTDGAYRLVRHPIYSGVLLLALGIASTAGSVVALVIFAVLVGVLSVKARFEESLLQRRFPGYLAYARATPRFVPRGTPRR
jgi:protein-S-isoprenylcysteine O-methyltransferase Ste14